MQNKKRRLIRSLKKITSHEIIRYIISGVLIAGINYGLFSIFLFGGISYKAGNVVAIVISKIVGFLLNKYMVYRTKGNGLRGAVKEVFWYSTVRGCTGVIDYFGVVFLAEVMSLNIYISKLGIMTLVVLLNYILGKLVVFPSNDRSGYTRSN